MKSTVRSYLKPYWPSFILALGQVFLISTLEILKPWPLKIIIDKQYVTEQDMAVSMGRVLNTPPINLIRMGIPHEVADLLPRAFTL